MTQPNQPPESNSARRRRLLSDTRRLTANIDKALLEYGESEQARHRERVNQEIEKFLPGVTEDENTFAGVYTPDPKYFAEDTSRGYRISPDAFEPIARVYSREPGEVVTGGSGHEDIPQWTTEDENEWQDRVELMRHGSRVKGTGEWAKSLSPEEVTYWSGRSHPEDHKDWVSGRNSPTYEASNLVSSDGDFGEERGSRVQLFEGNVLPNLSESINAPLDIDKRNVRQWAANHLKEVRETGIQDTEWKQRFEKLKQDVDETIFPVTDNQGAAIAKGNNTLKHHKNILNDIWNRHSVEQPTYPTQRNAENQSRGRRGPGRQVVTRSEVANRFAEGQTGRTSGRNFRVEEGGGGYTGRLDTGISETPSDTDTHTVYSYATPIAWRRQSGEVVMPTQRFSSTTNRHQSELRRALENQGYHSPQRIANQMLYTAYRQDARRASAGRAIGRRHYETGHDAEVYYPDAERAHDEARAIADTHYERINAMRQQRAASATARRSGSRAQRREQAGQLRLPMEGDNA